MNELYGCDNEWRVENRRKPVNRAPEWRLLLFSNRRKLPCCATRSVCAGRCASRGIVKSRLPETMLTYQ